MSDAINQKAAQWWADLFELEDKREDFKSALLLRLPKDDWELDSDYDTEGILFEAVTSLTPPAGVSFSDDRLFPSKTMMIREGDEVSYSQGYRAEWRKLLQDQDSQVAAVSDEKEG